MSDLVGIIEKDEIILILLDRLDQTEKLVLELKDEITQLKEQLISKNSRNSSKPPSTEIAPPKRTKSLRKATGLKPGGQLGHKGSGLKMVSEPDVVDKRIPKYCKGCGSDMSDTPAEFLGRRQLIDIPPIVPIVTEQQIYSRICTCGHTTCGQYSPNAKAPVGYGENIESMVAYFHARQYLPVNRMKELFNDLFGTSMSTGGISHILGRFAEKTTPVHDLIREKLQSSPFVGSDETGCKVNGKLDWFWVWQSPKLTYIAHSSSRGKKAIDDNFPNGFPNSILGHDAWRPQVNTVAKGHQLCTAHMLRELEYLKELYSNDPWAEHFSELLHRSLRLRYSMGQQKTVDPEEQRMRIMERFNELLTEPPDLKYSKAYTFFRRILRYQDHIFTFLSEPEAPPDNNSSERAIRNVKVKQKMSGQFKASTAAMNFAKVRSVIDTTIKNSQNVMEALRLIARGGFSLETNLDSE